MNNIPEIGTPARTEAVLNRYHLTAKKSLGQNFLKDINVLKNIVSAAEITEADDVIEIGPGIGSLTEQIAKKANSVLAFEIDQNLLPVLDDTLSQYDNIQIINQDFLKANLPELIEKYFDGRHHLKIVANLPYYITKPILMSIIKVPVNFDSVVIMMQKEVADRLTAIPGNRDYGALTVITQYLNDAKNVFDVSPKSFVPSPKVDSAIVRLTPVSKRNVEVFDEKTFFGFARGCFMHRRKTIWNNLQGVFGKKPDVKEQIKKILEELDVDAGVRPEDLEIDTIVKLANKFHQNGLLS